MITINNLVEVYELAKTYELNTLTNSWNCFVNRNSGEILKNKTFICQSFNVMEIILNLLNVNQSSIIYALQSIRDKNPNADMIQFAKLINFDRLYG
jgi:hypothetical protein